MSENDIELKITADSSSTSTLTENEFMKFVEEMNKYKKRNTATYQWVTQTITSNPVYPIYAESSSLEPEPLYNKHWV